MNFRKVSFGIFSFRFLNDLEWSLILLLILRLSQFMSLLPKLIYCDNPLEFGLPLESLERVLSSDLFTQHSGLVFFSLIGESLEFSLIKSMFSRILIAAQEFKSFQTVYSVRVDWTSLWPHKRYSRGRQLISVFSPAIRESCKISSCGDYNANFRALL